MEWYELPRRLRLLFQVEDINYRFYWFEFKDNNLYWGSSAKKHFSSEVQTLMVSPDRLSATIDVIPDMIHKEIKASKFSYHQSGKVHVKERELNDNENYRFKSEWLKPTDIKVPKLFLTIISKPISSYDRFTKNPLNNKTSAMIFKFDNPYKNCRCVFEFFLSPVGKFKVKDFLLKTTHPEQWKIFPLNLDLVLCFRNQIMSPDSELNSWQPDKEIILFRGDLN